MAKKIVLIYSDQDVNCVRDLMASEEMAQFRDLLASYARDHAMLGKKRRRTWGPRRTRTRTRPERGNDKPTVAADVGKKTH